MVPGELTRPPNADQVVEPWKPPTVGPTGYADLPLDNKQLTMLDQVIDSAERVTGLRFSVYLGALGLDSRATALSLHAGLAGDAPNGVLLAVSPGECVVEVVTGTVAGLRITDNAARLAVLNVISAATNGDLESALVNGIRTLADQAGTLPDRGSW